MSDKTKQCPQCGEEYGPESKWDLIRQRDAIAARVKELEAKLQKSNDDKIDLAAVANYMANRVKELEMEVHYLVDNITELEMQVAMYRPTVNLQIQSP